MGNGNKFPVNQFSTKLMRLLCLSYNIDYFKMLLHCTGNKTDI